MSFFLSSARRLATSSIASSPNALPARKEILCATASCLPTGWPHWTRSEANSRATLVAHFATPTQIAGSARRPVLRVDSAIFRPWPSLPIRFSFGTKTSSSSVTEFSIPRSPMKALRCSTVTPSVSSGRMKALIPPRWPDSSSFGTFAITTTTSAITPLVAQSLRPLSR